MRGRIAVDGRTIELEPGFRLDLGGIAKGYAVDRAAELLADAGPCLVNAGGDLAARGRSWPVGVETADGQITLALEDGAIATSGRDRRRWRRAGAEAHHLIDPAHGLAGGERLPARDRRRPDGRPRPRCSPRRVFLGAPSRQAAGRARHRRTDETVLAGGLA